MTVIKINEFAGVAIQDQSGNTIINNPYSGIHLVDVGHKTLKPGTNYLVTISVVQSTPDVVVQTEGDSTEEHS